MKILIDTNLHYQKKFDISNVDFLALKSYCKGYGTVMIIPDVQKREIFKKIEDMLSELDNKHLSQLRKVPIIKKFGLPSKANIVENLKASYEALFNEDWVVLVQTTMNDIKIILERYFECKPPFSKKKPKEFIDAFIAYNALQTGKELLVISKDEGMENFCTEMGIKYFQDIKTCLNLIYTEMDLKPAYLNEIIDKNWKAIEDQIKEKTDGYDVCILDVYDSDVYTDGISIEKDEDVLLINKTGDTYEICIHLQIKYSFSGTYTDEDCGYYDSEEDKFVAFESKDIGDYVKEVDGYVYISLTFDNKTLNCKECRVTNCDEIRIDDMYINEIYP